jgi:hypothetical protein
VYVLALLLNFFICTDTVNDVLLKRRLKIVYQKKLLKMHMTLCLRHRKNAGSLQRIFNYL